MAAETEVVFSGKNIRIVNVTGFFDSADETDTVVIDKSALVGPDGTEPGSIKVEEITWTVNGFNYVLLEWEHTTDDQIGYYQGSGYLNYLPFGGKNDPETAGGTGDIVLTTNGGVAGGSYTMLIALRLKD
jgi:hypothetical protein